VILTEDSAQGFEDQGFRGAELNDCTVIKIVKINIESWDWDAEEPLRYPAGGEPENYLERRKHATDVAASMPRLFWINAPEMFSYSPKSLLKDLRASPPDVDAFRTSMDLFVSERLRDWLAERAGKFVSFQSVE
jgi:hypothetical protein